MRFRPMASGSWVIDFVAKTSKKTISSGSVKNEVIDFSGGLSLSWDKGCLYCNNKFFYHCGRCGSIVCYQERNVKCPSCGTADVIGDRLLEKMDSKPFEN
jgi:hypothetical protein